MPKIAYSLDFFLRFVV